MFDHLNHVPAWSRFAWLRHGFTTRAGGHTSVYGSPGELNLGLTREDDPANVHRNRALLAGEFALATVSQVHGTQILRVTAGGPAGQADGLLTSTPAVLLGVMAADCVPVLLADTRLRVVAAVHAGWRGTAASIAHAAVTRLTLDFGSRPADLIAAIGPSIGPCCYTVGCELRPHFAPDLFTGQRLNLWEANRRQLASAGVRDITVLAECTACTLNPSGSRKYFSHRADAAITGRAMGIIGIHPNLS